MGNNYVTNPMSHSWGKNYVLHLGLLMGYNYVLSLHVKCPKVCT